MSAATAADLLDEGIRAYTRGDFAAAERCWTEVLALEPGHTRAHSYLELLGARAARQGAAARRQGSAGSTADARPGAEAPPAPPIASTAAPGARVPPAVAAPTSSPPTWLEPPADARPVGSVPFGDLPRAVDPPTGGAAHPHPAAADGATSPWDQGPSVAAPVVLEEGDGLDLSTVSERAEVNALVPEATPAVAAQRPRTEVEIWMEGARELFALGDFSGSLEMIEKILKVDPGHAEAREYLKQNEATLIAMYESKLGDPTAVPRLAIRPEEVMWLNLDHRAGFLLAQIDGSVSYEDLFALSGLPRLDTARILAALLGEGVIRS